MFGRFLVFFLIIALIEIYFLQAVKGFVQDFSHGKKNAILYTAYGFAILNFAFGLVSLFYPPPMWPNFPRYISAFLLILTVCKLFGISFLLIDDIIRLFRWIFSVVNRSISAGSFAGGEPVSRIKFFSQLALTFTVIPAIGFIYGMVRGAYKYRVHKVKVPSPKLPEPFHGFRIVQLSDIHTGSFIDNSALNRAFDIAMEQKPDLIVFTGDLVNNVADETNGYHEVYRKLSAPHGVYSVLGNHDYGDYVSWETPEEKSANLQRLKDIQASCGWKLLMNEHVTIEKDGHKLALLGIENWGGSMHFPKYGKLKDAYAGTENYDFKILLSHDPSHWQQEVSVHYPDIDLTLSGHTHGMQMGVEIPGFKWSPIKYFYKYWAGLYRQDQQFLYVNRGLGFLGYPGRLGIWPEITVLELQRA
jgi:uncharacterized protein